MCGCSNFTGEPGTFDSDQAFKDVMRAFNINPSSYPSKERLRDVAKDAYSKTMMFCVDNKLEPTYENIKAHQKEILEYVDQPKEKIIEKGEEKEKKMFVGRCFFIMVIIVVIIAALRKVGE